MPIGRLVATTLDTRDPAALAGFYCAVTGWKVLFTNDDYVYIGPEEPRLVFQRVADHTAPQWPSPVKQFHLDFAVADLDDAEKQLLELGATKPDVQPGGERWRVFSDPAGHQFCVMVMP